MVGIENFSSSGSSCRNTIVWSWWISASLSVNSLFHASLQSPGQYYFKPMMKEFRFEPSSQMIEVQEGQNLKIRVTGYRTAYRSVELKCRAKCDVLYQDALCVFSPDTPLF